MAIAEKLQNIINEKTAQATMTNYGLTSANQINSSTKFIDYPKYIFNAFLEALRTPDTLFTNLPKKSGTGANITLNDTANAPMKITLSPSELTQAGTPTPSIPQDIHTISGSNTIKIEGKNLLNPNGSTTSLNSITFTNNGDGTFTANGTASANTTFSLTTQQVTLVANQSYTQSLEILSGTFGGSIVPAFKNSGGTITYNYFNCNANSLTDTKTPTDTMKSHTYNLYIASGVSITNCTFRVQLEKGNAKTTYTPYISQEADINLSSKNLVNIGGDIATISNYYYTNKPLNFTITSDMEGKKLSLSYHIDITNFSSSASTMSSVLGYGATGFDTQLKSVAFSSVSAGSYDVKMENISITSAMVGKQLFIRYLAFSQQSTATYNATHIQLEYGETCTDYVEYYNPINYSKISTYEDKFIRTSGKNKLQPMADLTASNNGINLTNDNGIYTLSGTTGATASNITKSLNAEYTIQSGDYLYTGNDTTSSALSMALLYNGTQVIGPALSIANRVLDLSSYAGSKVNQIRFYTTANNSVNMVVKPMICNTSTLTDFEPYGSNEWYIKKNIGKVVLDGTEDGWAVDNTNQRAVYSNLSNVILKPSAEGTAMIGLCNNLPVKSFSQVYNQKIEGISCSSGGNLTLHVTGVTDTGTMTTSTWTTWLSNNNVALYYILATPTYTKITGTLAEQLEYVYQKLLSYDNTTNISQINNDLAFQLGVQAIEKL